MRIPFTTAYYRDRAVGLRKIIGSFLFDFKKDLYGVIPSSNSFQRQKDYRSFLNEICVVQCIKQFKSSITFCKH